MKTWHWVIILVVVAIVLFICGSFLHPFFSGGRHTIIKQYEVFRDLLAIVLTLAGLSIALLSTAMYKWISKSLETVVKKKVDEEVHFAMATFFLELSYDCWEAYEVKGKFQQGKRDQLEKAITLSKKALKRAEHLDTKQRKFEKILCSTKNSVAYHLAVRDCDDDAEKAILFAKYAYDRRNDFDFEDSCHWMETYGFVLIRMGTREQKKEGRKIIRGLKDRRYLPKTVPDSIDGKYTKNLAIRRGWS